MDLVLGLSVTSTAVRWVLVEGMTGEGAPVDRGALDITGDAPFDADGLLSVLLDANESVVESGVHAAGVTWTTDADAAAGAVLDALDARGLESVVSVSEIEAAEALASGIADIAGYDDVAVCIVEPDATLVAVVNADGVTVDRQDRPADGADNVELTSSVIALDLNDRQPDAIFVVGSADLDPVVSSMNTVAAAPVISSAEADMAMARGAAVASALAVNTLDVAAAPLMKLRRMSKTGVLTSVLVAAAVTLVVSLSVALGLRATPDSHSDQTSTANAAGEQVREATVPSAAKVAQGAPKLAPPPEAKSPAPAAARPLVAQTMVAAPPAPAAPAPDFDPPAAPPAPAYVPPAPAYVPPAPAPAYVPPAQPQVPAVQPEPRLRDKIIERIPIINRFHEPQYQYPTR
jgi:hypothetical protein